jgi:hypothetical protein
VKRAGEGFSWLSRLQLAGLSMAVLVALGFFLRFVHGFYPIQHWLFWHYLPAWIFALLWAASCISAGFGTLKLLLPSPLPAAEHFTLAFGVGLYEFFLALFVGGLFGLYGAVFFFLLPLALFAAGAVPLWHYLRRFHRHFRAARRRAPPPGPWSFVVFGFGLLGLSLIYFLILTPDNVSYDSRWQHLGLGEHYAAAGGIRRSPEGSYVAAAPHLAATIYGWALQMPLGSLFDRVALAAHMELVGFVLTMLGVAAIARRLVRGRRPKHAWAVRLLFPGVLLYDSSLSVGADHVAAFFAAPIFLSMLRAWQWPSPRWLLLLVVSLAGAAMTKYTGALSLIGFPIFLLAVRFLIELLRHVFRRGRVPVSTLLAAMGTAFGAGLLLTAPHWLKNWIWYADPVYPLLHRHLALDPWTQDSAQRFAAFLKTQLWRPERTWAGLWESIKVIFTWAFIPNDWAQFHGKLPVFGTLFSMGLVLLPFLRRTRRLWALYAMVHAGVFVWYWIHHQDRYLQAVMPIIAGGTAAVLTLAWREHWSTKIAISGMVCGSVIWGGDVWFIPTHAMITSPQKETLDLFAAGYKKSYAARFELYGANSRVSEKLPRDAVILLHDERMRLGLNRPTIQDSVMNQGGISYARFESPQALHHAYRKMGVTHLVWHNTKSSNQDSLAGDFVFFDFALNVAVEREMIGYAVARLAPEPPTTRWRDRVLVLGCPRGEYETGLYRLDQLTLPVILDGPRPPRPAPISKPEQAAIASAVDQVDFVSIERRCHDAAALKGKPFELIAKRLHQDLWIRRRPAR